MITKKDLKGKICNFPLDVVEKMLERQKEQTGKEDVTEFQKDEMAGFRWFSTPEGLNFWDAVINEHDWVTFWKRYPSQPKPKYHKTPTHDVSVTEKVCCDCGRLLPASAFNPNRWQANGLQAYCKECQAKRGKEYRAKRKAAMLVDKAVEKLQSVLVEKPDLGFLAKFDTHTLIDGVILRDGVGQFLHDVTNEELVEELKRRMK